MKNIIIISLLFLVSCKASNSVTYRATTDSVYVDKYIYKTQVVKDTIFLQTLPTERDIDISSDTAYAETTLAWAVSYLNRGCVFLEIKNKDRAKLPYRIEYKTEYIRDSTNRKSTEDDKIERVIEVYKMNLFQKIFFWIGLVLSFIFLVYFLLKLKRFWL